MLHKRWAPIALILILIEPAVAAPATRTEQPRSARDIVAMGQALPDTGINELKPVRIGGIQQWLSIRSARRDNPILLFLHGGPGWPMMPLSWTFQRPWEDFFMVVQWDQRGAGKTLASNPNSPPPTLEQMESDTAEVADYLRQTFHRNKIFVIGHSWGSILGVRLALQHPDWLYAYIGAGQVVNGSQNEKVGYGLVLQQAEHDDNQKAVVALRRIAPYPRPDGTISRNMIMTECTWDVALRGMRYGQAMEDDETIAKLSPDYSDDDLKAFSRGANMSETALGPVLEKTDFSHDTVFACPVMLFVGRHDMTTPASIAERWFASLQSPHKKMFILDNSAHMIFDEEPGQVLVHLIRDVLPLAARSP